MEAKFYLKSLVIQNFATFRNQTIHFRPGFNAIIGETGSGKSLVLEALQLILGGRADKKIVRKDAEFSLIEATFKCEDQGIKSFLEAEGYPSDGRELYIKRLIYRNGTSKTYVNHLSSTLNFLIFIAKKYIDLVGQFENQRLLSESYHLQLLDHFSKSNIEISQFQTTLKTFKELNQKHENLLQTKILREQRLDYLNYQLTEIEKLNPSSQEEVDLINKKNMLVNLERNQKLSTLLNDVLSGTDGQAGLREQLRLVVSILAKNRDLFGDLVNTSSELQDSFENIFEAIERKVNHEVDQEELEGVIERLDLYQKLKKKFGGSVETILQSQVEFMKERDHLQELEVDLESIAKNISDVKIKLTKQANALHQVRAANSIRLSEALTQRVQALNMNGARIKMVVEQLTEFTEFGMSKAYFMAETNQGEGFYKIKDIASGGELSRILLSVRQILSSCDSISIFLFDEIDTGIGGETANCIGKALKEVAANGQVIAITHLPQIAQFSDSLIVVNKDSKNSRTESYVRELVGRMIHKEVKSMAQLHQ